MTKRFLETLSEINTKLTNLYETCEKTFELQQAVTANEELTLTASTKNLQIKFTDFYGADEKKLLCCLFEKKDNELLSELFNLADHLQELCAWEND